MSSISKTSLFVSSMADAKIERCIDTTDLEIRCNYFDEDLVAEKFPNLRDLVVFTDEEITDYKSVVKAFPNLVSFLNRFDVAGQDYHIKMMWYGYWEVEIFNTLEMKTYKF